MRSSGSDRYQFNINLPDAKTWDDFALKQRDYPQYDLPAEGSARFSVAAAEWGGYRTLKTSYLTPTGPMNFLDVNPSRDSTLTNGINELDFRFYE